MVRTEFLLWRECVCVFACMACFPGRWSWLELIHSRTNSLWIQEKLVVGVGWWLRKWGCKAKRCGLPLFVTNQPPLISSSDRLRGRHFPQKWVNLIIKPFVRKIGSGKFQSRFFCWVGSMGTTPMGQCWLRWSRFLKNKTLYHLSFVYVTANQGKPGPYGRLPKKS